MSEQAAFHADMLALERRVDELLLASAARPLTEAEVLDLRLFAGVPARTAKPARVVADTHSELVPF